MLCKRKGDEKMGILVKGKWQDKTLAALKNEGIKADGSFRNWVTPDGSAGPTGKGGFKAQKGRYQLYVSYACPWASRALIMWSLKGLQDYIGLSVTDPIKGDDGWKFSAGADPVLDARHIAGVYVKAKPDYTGVASVPVLWDKETNQIVNNESADIMRILETAFDELTGDQVDYYPEALRPQIDELNAYLDKSLIGQLSKVSSAKTQAAYEAAVKNVFSVLDELESRLSKQKYLLTDDIPVESDWRLLPTLVRFDIVYYERDHCNLRRLVDYPHLWAYARRLYQTKTVAETVNFEQIKVHNYHPIIPLGPLENWQA